MHHLPRRLASALLGPATLAGLVLGFLATAFAGPGRLHLSSSGLLQHDPLTRIGVEAASFGRPCLEAVAWTEPSARFERRELREARAPLWNPWNATGAPHLAAGDSAALSPFSVPAYLLDGRSGPLASAALQLFALGLFTFLLLRQLQLSSLAALVGATSFTFAGAHLPELAISRAGALSAMPAALLFAEKALSRLQAVTLAEPGERRRSPRVRAPLAGLAVALAMAVLCGSPGALAVSLLILGAWIGGRLFQIAFTASAAGNSLRPMALFAAKTALALVLAAGSVAFRILPWFEAAQQAGQGLLSSRGTAPLELDPWQLLFFPCALGDPRGAESLSAYVGGFVLFLALLALPFARRDPRIGFFLAFGVLGLAVASGAAPRLGGLAGAGLPLGERGQGAWAFGLSCAAALAVEHVGRPRDSAAWGRAILTALAGLAFLVLFRLGVERLGTPPGISPHLRRMAVLFAAGLVALCLLWVARASRARLVAGSALVLVAFLGSGPILADLVPRCDESLVFPRTPAIQVLQRRVGRDRLVVLDEAGLPPQANLAYELGILPCRAGLTIEPFATLFRASFGGSETSGPVRSVSERALQTFGVRWVLAREPFELADGRPGSFERVERLGEFGLYRCTASRGKAWIVRHSIVSDRAEQALDLVLDPRFDPLRTVVLGPEAGRASTREAEAGSPDPPIGTPARVVEETSTWTRFEVDCSAPEILVLAQAWYPGWRAHVNGIERTLHRGNYAFTALELQRGLNVVDLSYEPECYRIGLWIALACLLSGLLCLFHRPWW